MDLKKQFQKDLRDALKQKNEKVASTLRLVLASVQNKEIELGKKEKGLSEEETQKVIKGEAKKRKDSIEAYEKAQRSDLKEKEEAELKILEKYLPPELPDEEIEKIVKETIAESGSTSQTDFGKVMGAAMGKLKGRADGNKVGSIVKKLLND